LWETPLGQGAQKFQQVGADAFCKMVQATLQGVEFKARKAVVMLDLNLGVGESLDAYCMLKAPRGTVQRKRPGV
jgi:hypothetical protein